jgi:hypothetical protein
VIAAAVSSEVWTARITSTSFSTGTGLKKCIPITRSGRCVTAQLGRNEVVDGRHASEDLVWIGPALLSQLLEALAHRGQPAIGGARSGVVERDAASRGGHHLRDAAAHLARTRDENVLERHTRASVSGTPGRGSGVPIA